MENLHLGDRGGSDVIFQVRECNAGIRIDLILPGNPAPALPEKTKEERTAFIYSVKADLDNVFIGCIRLGDTPPEVNINQTEFALFAPFPKFREYTLDEVVPFRVHVIEGAAYKDADGLPGSNPLLMRRR